MATSTKDVGVLAFKQPLKWLPVLCALLKQSNGGLAPEVLCAWLERLHHSLYTDPVIVQVNRSDHSLLWLLTCTCQLAVHFLDLAKAQQREEALKCEHQWQVCVVPSPDIGSTCAAGLACFLILGLLSWLDELLFRGSAAHTCSLQAIAERLIEVLRSHQISDQLYDASALAISAALKLLPTLSSRSLVCSIAACLQKPLRTPAAMLIFQCCSGGAHSSHVHP